MISAPPHGPDGELVSRDAGFSTTVEWAVLAPSPEGERRLLRDRVTVLVTHHVQRRRVRSDESE
jgi:hypothetical protein